MRVGLLFTMVIWTQVALSQVPVNSAADGSIFWGNAVDIDRSIPYENIKGSPYHEDPLIMGQLFFADDTLRRYLRYNAYTDEIEYVQDNRILALAEPERTTGIMINNVVYRWETYTQGFGVNKGYFVELVGGNCRLLKRDLVKFEQAKPPKTSYHQPTPHRFVKIQADYFTSCPNEILEPFTNTGIQLKKLAAGDLESIESYIKDNKLKMRKEEHMIQLFQYLNGIN